MSFTDNTIDIIFGICRKKKMRNQRRRQKKRKLQRKPDLYPVHLYQEPHMVCLDASTFQKIPLSINISSLLCKGVSPQVGYRVIAHKNHN